MRRKPLDEPSFRQSHIILNTASADLRNNQTEAGHQPVAINTTTDHGNHPRNKLFIHYTHEKRFHSFKRDMHRVYENTFGSTYAGNAQIVVGNRNRRDIKNELIHKGPKHRFLQNILTQSKLSQTIHLF
jgi:hypothetical protein